MIRYDDADTHGLREAHGFSLAWYDGRLLLAAQAVRGIQIWDVTDPMAISMLAYLDIPGVDRGDYSGDWWTFWQAPWLYVAGVDRGLYVVDATDPANPAVVAQVPTGELGGVSPAQVFALGNLAVVMQTQGSDFASLDISIPEQPRLLSKYRGRSGYSHLFAGDGKILTSGNIPPRAHFFQLSPEGNFTYLDTVGFYFDSGGYGSYQDGVFHSGFSDDYRKFTIDPPEDVGSGSSGRADRDEDFATVLGNLVFAGDDHGVGTALIPHQRAPDTNPPVVEWMHPPAGRTGVALTARIGLSFSDHVDAASLSSATIRLEDPSGAEVPVRRSAQMGLVNLAPIQPLALMTTYTVIAEGVRDVAGNASPAFVATFTTGDGSVATAPTAAVANVDVDIAFGSYALGIFDAGASVYSDRNYTFTTAFPARLHRQAYLQTANVDKNNILTRFLSFDLLAPAEVLLLYDQRAGGAPSWATNGGFVATSETVDTTDTTFDVYARRFPAGRVELGGNQGRLTGADSMYTVVIVPDPVPCAIDLAPVQTGTITLSAAGPAGGTYTWQIRNQTFTGPSPQVFLPPGRHGVRLAVTDGPLSASCGGVLVAHEPLADVRGRTARKLVWHEGDVINVNPDQGTVTRIDPRTGAIRWRATGLAEPSSLTVRGAEVWVADRGASAVIRLSAANGGWAGAIPLGRETQPTSIVTAPDGEVFVTLSASGEVVRIDEFSVAARRFVTPTAHGLTWFDDRLYVTRFRSRASHGEVHVLSAETLNPRDVVELAFDPGPDTEANGRGVPNYVAQVEVAPDGQRAFVASKKDNVARGLARDGEPLTFESRVRTIVSSIDLTTAREDLSARLDVNDRDMVQATLTSPLGDLLFVLSQGGRFVDVFDTHTWERAAQFEVGWAPQDLALDPFTGRLAVYSYLSRQIEIFNVEGLLSGQANAPVRLGTHSTVDVEALDPLVLQGKRIFFDAKDERMSRDGYLSCASCHMRGEHDGQVWDFTQSGEGLRNTIALNGRAGLGHGRVHWTANFDEIQDFENDIRNAFGGKGFLSDADFVATEDPLGLPKAGLSPELDALAAYVATLDTPPASPHRAGDGSLTAAARRGREVFRNSNCQNCHSGPTFSDGLRHDVGTISMTSGLGIGAPLEGVGFDTPTLLGVWDGAPYLHDGSAASLTEVFARHGDIPALDEDSQSDLLAYLRALDGTSLAPEADCRADPYECVEASPVEPDAGVVFDGGPDGGFVPPDPVLPPEPSGCRCAGAPAPRGAGWRLGLGLVGLAGLGGVGRRRRR